MHMYGRSDSCTFDALLVKYAVRMNVCVCLSLSHTHIQRGGAGGGGKEQE